MKLRLRTINEALGKEYVVWGIPKGGTEEALLLTKFEGKPITDKGMAEKLAKLLTDKHGCTKTRVQEVDLTDNKIEF